MLISKGNGTRYSGFQAATGNEIDLFCQQGVATKFELKDFPGRVIDAWDGTRTDVTPKGSVVLGASASGRTMVTSHAYGRGRVLYCNFPIESDSVYRTDCFTGEHPNPRYLVYRTAAKAAGIVRTVEKELPGVGITEHRLPDGRVACVAVNYEPSPASCPVSFSGRVTQSWGAGSVRDGKLEIGANDALVFIVEK